MRWLTHVVALELSRKLCDSEHALTLAFVVRRQLLYTYLLIIEVETNGSFPKYEN